MEADNIINNFYSEEEMNENNIGLNQDPLAINPNDYEMTKTIKFFQTLKLIKDRAICTKCNKEMNIEKFLTYIDKYCWRCRSNGPKHDIKINIKIGSFFESMRVPLNALYYLIYNCFLNQFSINRAYNEMVNFSNILETGTISQHLIIKI